MASRGQELVWNHSSHHKPEYEALEGTKKWTGQWELHERDMTWWRPQFFYFRHRGGENTGKVCQDIQLGCGPMVRPWPIHEVVHLDVPLAVLRSHPDTLTALDDAHEGMWIDTNPAWPEKTVDLKLGELGVYTAWDEFSAEAPKEIFEFDGLYSKILEAHVIYVRPLEQAKAA